MYSPSTAQSAPHRGKVTIWSINPTGSTPSGNISITKSSEGSHSPDEENILQTPQWKWIE